MGWLEYDRFLLGVCLIFRGVLVSFRECNSLTWWNHGCLHSPWNYQLDFPLKNTPFASKGMAYLPTKLIFRGFFLAVSSREGRSWNILGSTHSLHEMTSHYIPTGMLWTSKSWQTIICRTWSSIHSQRLGTTLTFSDSSEISHPFFEVNNWNWMTMTHMNKVCAMNVPNN